MVQESVFYFQVKIAHRDRSALMSTLIPQALKPQIPSPTIVPSFWCVTCQMSLRSQDEQLAHSVLFPTHTIRTMKRTTCPGCGNEVPLENGRLPVHWVGYGDDPRKCTGSGKRP